MIQRVEYYLGKCFKFHHAVSCVNDYVVPLCMRSKVGYTWQILVSYTHPTFKYFFKVQYSITGVLEGNCNVDRNQRRFWFIIYRNYIDSVFVKVHG